MMRTVSIWLGAAGLSGLAHLLVFGGLLALLDPEPPPQQDAPQASLRLSAYGVAQVKANAAAPEAEPLGERPPPSLAAQGDAIPQSRARPATPRAQPAALAKDQSVAAPARAPEATAGVARPPSAAAAPSAALAVVAAPLMPADAVAQSVAAPARAPEATAGVARPPSAAAAPSAALAVVAAPLMPTDAVAQSVAASAQAGPILASETAIASAQAAPVAPVSSPAAPATPPPTVTASSPVAVAARVPTAAPQTAAVTAMPAAALPAPRVAAAIRKASATAIPQARVAGVAAATAAQRPPQVPAAGAPVAPARPDARAAPRPAWGTVTAAAAPSPPQAAPIKAALAWTGGDTARIDPASLAAIQSFTAGGALEGSAANAGTVRDGIAGVLAGTPCARLQTTFVPERGVLELRGHIPRDDLRGPLLAALRAEVGGSIPLADNLLILPPPTCTALTGIAATGLAQSTEQTTNPSVVGPNAHARLYDFRAGEQLSFELQGADYPAYFYIDFFDAEGNVVHLQPNAFVPLARIGVKERLVVGGDSGLKITVTPPFGQEIMVAFAASRPLYEGVRPLQETAGPYLRFLRDRVAAARAADPDFKGEWVYFFVQTRP